MDRIKLTEDLSFSKIVHGLWRLSEWNMSKEQILRFIEECLELGITTFDHADIYGNYTCEELFGEALALKPSLRGQMEIVTKCGIKLLSDKYPEHEVKYYDTSKDHINKSVENSLRKLQTDYIDVLLIHRPDVYMNPEEVAETFIQLKDEGKVRNFGVSNFTPSQFNMLSSYLPFPLVTNQVEISVGHIDTFLDGTIEQCLEKRVAPMAWSPLAGGNIFNGIDEKSTRILKALKEVAQEIGVTELDQLMFAWLLNHPARIIPIAGSGKIERIKSAAHAVNITLTRQQWFKIWIASLGKEVA
ncbi:aldo/keto reductase [Bacillus sp. 31A1R]|uniref:Aldo/keto reductase n=1 Tax=Robertmurraya mangrovi TaxID=3098077 RepID=A0ABU5J3H4_9BACI|nr:aldo/keto reductase [Bacillus sp. 31A1R]MDZ5473970.1 aldo/keto reductase [Bacillus sp. 31A1R]